MSLVIGDNFSYQGAKPLDARLKYDTLAQMKAMADSVLYDGCLAFCKEDSKTYQWISTNEVDATTGRWREFKSGSDGGGIIAYLSKDGNLEETPIGSIISYVGNNVPKHYLACNGSEYNINDYPELAIHIKESCGSFNYFGGDGVTTFAVPNYFSWWQPTLVDGLIPRPYSALVSSSYSTTQYQKELMFDGVISKDSCWHSAADGSDTDIWVKFDFGKNTGVNGLRMAARDTNYLHQLPSTFTIEGSYDDVTYTVIKSYSGLPTPASTAFREHIFDKPVNYRYYKLNHITSNTKNDGHDYCSIAELEFSKVDNTQYIKYETTHKIFFGDQTTYKVSVPFTRATGAGTISLTLDNDNAEDDISMLNGNTLVAPMDGYYAISYYSKQFSDNSGSIDTRIKVDGNVISSDSAVKNSGVGISIVNSIIIKLKKNQVITFTVYTETNVSSFNGTITMALVNTLNENKTAELMNKPNLWEPGKEYDFGDGVYGQRFTGNMPTIAAGKSANRIIDYSISNSSNAKIIDTGGYIEMFNANDDRVIIQANTVRRAADANSLQAPLAMGWSSILIMGNNDIIMNAGSYSNDHSTTSNTYDVWVKYTK